MCIRIPSNTEMADDESDLQNARQRSNGSAFHFTRNERNAKLTFVMWNIDKMHCLIEMLLCWPSCEDWCSVIVEDHGDVESLQIHPAPDLSNSTPKSSSHDAPLWLLRQSVSPPPRLSAPSRSTPGRKPSSLCTPPLALLLWDSLFARILLQRVGT